MSADFIQLLGCDVPDSSGGCCFSGYIQQDGALECPSEPMQLDSAVTSSTVSGSESQLLFFNCPEGTQRFAAEANIRLVRTRCFFFTRWSPSTTMGMPGLLFTVNDAGIRHANFFGPTTTSSGLAAMLAALRQHYFQYRPMSFQQLRAGGSKPRRWETPLKGNYIYDVPMQPQKEEEEEEKEENNNLSHGSEESLEDKDTTYEMDTTASFIPMALPLSETSALLAFRVSPESGVAAVYSYAILHAPTASFDPRRAKSLGIPPGPLYGELKKGRSVWIDDSAAPDGRRRIDPSEVKQTTIASQRLYVTLVLDGDSTEDMGAALSRFWGNDESCGKSSKGCENDGGVVESEMRRFVSQWKPTLLHCDGDTQQEREWELTHIVHVQSEKFFLSFLPLSALSSTSTSSLFSQYIGSVFATVGARVREQAFRTARHHFSAVLQREFSAFPTALTHRYHLHSIAPADFPLPVTNTDSSAEEEGNAHGGASVAWPFFEKHTLVPPNANGTAKIREPATILRYPTYRSAIGMLSEAFRDRIARHFALLRGDDAQFNVTRNDRAPFGVATDGGGALTFLGTGSAVPSKYRNVSGTLLEIYYASSPTAAPRRGIVVLDFGEGNMGQLSSLWGRCPEARERFFADLLFIFISHAHADHHLGLLSLLSLCPAPPLVVCPEEVRAFLHDAWGPGAVAARFDVFPAEHNDRKVPGDFSQLRALCRDLAGEWDAEIVPVRHPANAHALLLRFPAGESNAASRVMMFSGDTRPSGALNRKCMEFAREGEIFLCLHEATFGEGYEDEAERKCHSTLPEALRVAEEIGARHVVLNHFSQRYPKLPGLMKSQLDGKEVDLHCRHKVFKSAPDKSLVTSNNGRSIVYGEKCNGVEEGGDNEDNNKEMSIAQRMCFGFDFMRLSFASLESGRTARLRPIFVQLLEEYESWAVGTTKRLRQ